MARGRSPRPAWVPWPIPLLRRPPPPGPGSTACSRPCAASACAATPTTAGSPACAPASPTGWASTRSSSAASSSSCSSSAGSADSPTSCVGAAARPERQNPRRGRAARRRLGHRAAHRHRDRARQQHLRPLVAVDHPPAGRTPGLVGDPVRPAGQDARADERGSPRVRQQVRGDLLRPPPPPPPTPPRPPRTEPPPMSSTAPPAPAAPPHGWVPAAPAPSSPRARGPPSPPRGGFLGLLSRPASPSPATASAPGMRAERLLGSPEILAAASPLPPPGSPSSSSAWPADVPASRLPRHGRRPRRRRRHLGAEPARRWCRRAPVGRACRPRAGSA